MSIKPSFFIVGAPKCGTTAMSDYLAAHPEIFMARKEMHFFGSDLLFAPQFYRRNKREYLAECNAANNQRRVGEASVWYLFSETAAAEIKAFNPQARVIVLLREPVEMLHSLFHAFQYDGNEPLPAFEEALNAEEDRRAGRRIGRQTYFAQGLVYRQAARFAEQVRRYFDVFGRERVQVVLHEDLAADPAAVYRELLEFLEVDPTHKLTEFPTVNPSKTVRSRTLRAVLNDSAVRSTLLAMQPAMPRRVFNAFHRIERTLSRHNSSSEKRPPLDPELRSRLQHDFAPEVGRLGDLIGRNLTHWSRADAPAQRPVARRVVV
jgi:Sulfotransferase domain